MSAASMLGSLTHQEDDSIHLDKLTYEIFSILENKFLFETSPASTKPLSGNGKVRILSIDAGGSTDGVLAAKSLAQLESTLKYKSGNPNARVSDFFDVVAGAGAGGILAGMLFTRGKDGNPIATAQEALKFVMKNAGKFSGPAPAGSFVKRVFGSVKSDRVGLGKVFGELTLKDTVKAVLIPCYDLSTGAPFLFSRADALEMDGCDFRMADACRATIASRALDVKSTDGRKRIAAVGGGIAMNNPTAAAITHVLNNKQEFPFCKGVEDLVVVSLGNGEMDCLAGIHGSTPAAFVSIAGDGAADMVDQAVSMAFGQSRASSYVRIQGNGIVGNTNAYQSQEKKNLGMVTDQMLSQKNVESILFQGKKLSETTNMEKLDLFASELIKEQEWRKTSVLPPVILKHSSTSYSSPPRSSSSSATTLSTLSSS